MKKHNVTEPQATTRKTANTIVDTELNDQQLDEVVGGGLRNLVKGSGRVVLALGPKQDDPRDIGNY